MVSHVSCSEEMLAFEADEKLHLTMPEGLLGFEESKDYLLFGSKDLYPFRILQSLDEPTVIFVVVEPHHFFKGYELELSHTDMRLLKLSNPSEAMVLTILVVPQDPLEMTANLLAPLVVNIRKRLAKQVVLHNSSYSIRERVFARASPRQAVAPCLIAAGCRGE